MKIDYGSGYDPHNRPSVLTPRKTLDYGSGYDPHNRPSVLTPRKTLDYGSGYDPHNRPSVSTPRKPLDYGSGYDPHNRPCKVSDYALRNTAENNWVGALETSSSRHSGTLSRSVLVLKVYLDGMISNTDMHYAFSSYDPRQRKDNA